MFVGRLVNGERKIINPKPENAGKLLIFCEGFTEYNYLEYFKVYLEKNLRAQYSEIVLEPINTEGNAMRVYQYAEEFLDNDENKRKYDLYEKHLVFDCDAPKEIDKVIQLMRESKNDYILDYSNLLFETWLVMHFQNVLPEEDNKKRNIIRCMREFLGVQRYTTKVKAAKGTIGKILGNDGNRRIRAAVENAKRLEAYWEQKGLELEKDVKSMNPSVGIYKLIERLLDEVVYLCG